MIVIKIFRFFYRAVVPSSGRAGGPPPGTSRRAEGAKVEQVRMWDGVGAHQPFFFSCNPVHPARSIARSIAIDRSLDRDRSRETLRDYFFRDLICEVFLNRKKNQLFGFTWEPTSRFLLSRFSSGIGVSTYLCQQGAGETDGKRAWGERWRRSPHRRRRRRHRGW